MTEPATTLAQPAVPSPVQPLPWYGGRAGLILSAMLLFQAAATYFFSRPETPFPVQPLHRFAAQLNGWQEIADNPVEAEVQRVLRADDTLNRVYSSPAYPEQVNFFVAFFRSQRTGVSPHSPKNCLPGSGFVPVQSGTVEIALPSGKSIEVNRYVVSRGDVRTLVYYWYQTPRSVVASEYWAKIWLVLDSIRYHRSDTAMVRVVIPIEPGKQAHAEQVGQDFIRAAFAPLGEVLPSAQ